MPSLLSAAVEAAGAAAVLGLLPDAVSSQLAAVVRMVVGREDALQPIHLCTETPRRRRRPRPAMFSLSLFSLTSPLRVSRN